MNGFKELLKTDGENGHQMAQSSYEFWSYVDWLKENGELEETAGFFEAMTCIEAKAAAGDARAARWIKSPTDGITEE